MLAHLASTLSKRANPPRHPHPPLEIIVWLTLTIAARFNKDSHKSPTMPTTHPPTPATQSHADVIPPRENASSEETADAEGTNCDSAAITGPTTRAVSVPKEIAPATPTQVLFGLAMARVLGRAPEHEAVAVALAVAA